MDEDNSELKLLAETLISEITSFKRRWEQAEVSLFAKSGAGILLLIICLYFSLLARKY